MEMMADENKYTIPHVSIQHDWFDELKYEGRKVWISSSNGKDKKSAYSEIQSTVKDTDTKLMCKDDGFQVELVRKHALMVKYKPHQITSYFFNPTKSFTKLHNKAIECLDISPGGGLGVSCAADGKLLVWQTTDGVLRRSLEGHINDVSHCRFFPSGVVVLSGGSDMCLKIWSVEDGSCPVTLMGHTAAITDSAIIERGRNIVSSSRDGSLKLWDCGSGKCLSTILKTTSIINKCCMKTYSSKQTNVNGDERSEKEVGTDNKLVFVGTENCQLVGCDLSSRDKVFTMSCSSAVNSCCYFDDDYVATGLEDGSIMIYDLRNTKYAYSHLEIGKSRILCITPYPGKSLLIGKGDGSCSCIQPIESTNTITMELTGPDCDPIYDLSLHDNFVYTASRDKTIRKYRMDLNT